MKLEDLGLSKEEKITEDKDTARNKALMMVEDRINNILKFTRKGGLLSKSLYDNRLDRTLENANKHLINALNVIQDLQVALDAERGLDTLSYSFGRIKETYELEEGFSVNVGSHGRVPVGHFTWLYIPKNPKDLDFISNSAIHRGIKELHVVKTVGKGKGIEITATAPEHQSLIRSFQSLQFNGEVIDPTNPENR